MQFIPLSNLETVARVTRESAAGGFSALTYAWSFRPQCLYRYSTPPWVRCEACGEYHLRGNEVPRVPLLSEAVRCWRCHVREATTASGQCGQCFQDEVERDRMKSYGSL